MIATLPAIRPSGVEQSAISDPIVIGASVLVLSSLQSDKKVRGGKVSFVLSNANGCLPAGPG